jgi:hypothetical protein
MLAGQFALFAAAGSGRSPVLAQGGPAPFDLGETLFVYDYIERDRDADGLKDNLEHALAEQFKPIFVFDSKENHRRSDEPRVLFQVRPEGCIGQGCPTPWVVRIKFGFLYQEDGGYGESSICKNAHNGDNQGATFKLESYTGRSWNLVEIDNAPFFWPQPVNMPYHYGNTPQWEGSHVLIYMSSHKHHQYFSTAYDEEDSVYSDWNCSDDVDGKGARIPANLISPLADKRPNNVGEPHAHSPAYFIGKLDSFGYKGEDAWSDKDFTGGLADDKEEGDTGDTTGLKQMWWTTGDFDFWFGNGFTYRPLAVIKGRVTDSNGKPIPGVKLYYRNIDPLGVVFGGGRGPWATLPVDANGNYEARLFGSLYTIRPAASQYDFTDVPRPVHAKEGEVTVRNFVGTRPPVSIGSIRQDIGEVETIERDQRIQRVISVSNAALKELGVLHIAAPDRMVGPDPKALDKGVGEDDPLIELPRQFTMGVHLDSVLDSDGNPAKTPGEISYTIPKVTVNHLGQTQIGPTLPKLGGPVAGARLRARLVFGKGLTPLAEGRGGNSGWAEVTTTARGDAFWMLRSGVHPGWTRLEVEVIENPANPWVVGSLKTDRIEIQPALHGDDSLTNPRLTLRALPTFNPGARWWGGGGVGRRSILSNKSVSRVLLRGDINLDDVIDAKDLKLLGTAKGKRDGETGYRPAADLNYDGVVDEKDEAALQQNMARIIKTRRR